MTKFNSFKFLLCAMMAAPLLSVAQPKMGAWNPDPNNDTTGHNFYINYVGGRVIINSPSSLAGPVLHTISNDGTGSNWGGSIKGLVNPINDVDIVKAAPFDGCGALTNAGAMNGKIALIQRGSCEFGTKALNAQNAGAVAVIIVNNVPGAAVGMGAGSNGASVTIPVLMVSDVDGAAIDAALGSGAVKVSMTVWGNGYNDDIGFIGLGGWHAQSIPLDQLKGSTAQAYKGLTTAVVGNFGTTTATSVKMRTILNWTPTGGSTTEVRRDSVTFVNFAAIDSIANPIVNSLYDLAPTGTGRYDIEYELIPNFTDQSPGDNKARHSFYVHDNIYSKGRYDFANNRAISGVGYRLGQGTTSFTWGNFIYADKGSFAIEKVQIALSNGSATNNSMVGFTPAQIVVYKWTDNGDSIIRGSELSPVGFGEHKFVAGDTSGQVHDIIIKDIPGTGKCTTQANTWYWVAAAMPIGAYINVDGATNYFTRSWARQHVTNKFREPYSPLFPETYSNLASAANPLQHYPFESYFFMEDSIRFAQQKTGLVPSLPVHMSLFKVGVNDVVKNAGFDINLYPNPASEILNVSLDKNADEVYYTLMTVTGTRISTEKRTNVTTKDKYSISTADLPAGNYMLFVNVDGESAVRQFSVVK